MQWIRAIGWLLMFAVYDAVYLVVVGVEGEHEPSFIHFKGHWCDCVGSGLRIGDANSAVLGIFRREGKPLT